MGKGFKRLWRRNVLWKNSDAGGKSNPNALPAFLKQVAEMSEEEYAAKEAELLAILEEKLEKVVQVREARRAEAAKQAAEATKAAEPAPRPTSKKKASPRPKKATSRRSTSRRGSTKKSSNE